MTGGSGCTGRRRLKRLSEPRLKHAYQQCEDLQIVQGIDRYIECDPEKIVEYIAVAKSEKLRRALLTGPDITSHEHI